MELAAQILTDIHLVSQRIILKLVELPAQLAITQDLVPAALDLGSINR